MATNNKNNSFHVLGLNIGIILLILTLYIYGYGFFTGLGIHVSLIDKSIVFINKRIKIVQTTDIILKSLTALLFLSYIFGSNYKKKIDEKNEKKYLTWGLSSLFVFVIIDTLLFLFKAINLNPVFIFSSIYLLVSIVSLSLFTRNLSLYFAIKYRKRSGMESPDINDNNLVQEKKLVETIDSVNIPAKNKKGERYWWNFVLPQGGTIVTGNPGTGKSYVFVYEFIRQLMKKGWTLCIYDFKRGELTDMVFHYYVKYQHIIEKLFPKGKAPKLAAVDFDDPWRSVQINPLSHKILLDENDCIDAAEVFALNINRSWIEKKGEFFPESGQRLIATNIAFLRYTTLKNKTDINGMPMTPFEGNCSTLPHAIALLFVDREKLFNVLGNHPKTKYLFSAFVDAVGDGAGEQLSGQTATIKIALSIFMSKKIFWTLSGEDVTTYVSSKEEPLYLCLINNEQKRAVYGPALSLILGQVIKKVNNKGNYPVHLSIDELATVYIKDIDILIATARSNMVAVLLGFQDMAQLIKDYGDKVAKAIANTVGNMITGRVRKETAKDMQDTVGKRHVKKISTSISESGVSISESYQLEYAIPAEKVSSLSQGEFVMQMADTVENPLENKIANNFADIDALEDERIEHKSNQHITKLKRPPYKQHLFMDQDGKDITEELLQRNFDKIIEEVNMIVEQEYERMVQEGIIVA